MLRILFSKKASIAKKEYTDDPYFAELRKTEYPELDRQGQVYLDYTGGNLSPKSLLDQHFDGLRKNILGNPHSTNPTSQLATQRVEEARRSVLDFFNADDYFCIFTPNASGALKIIGECYPFGEKGQLLLSADNHNSVNGIREYCNGKKASFQYVPIQYEDLQLDKEKLENELSSYPDKENKLFAFPAQSNVSGVKHDLSWIQKASEKGWDVLLDAAAFVPTSKLDLGVYQPDFVSVSFYKIFGYPTGLGCLLVKKSKFSKLQKQWFAGGTVTLAAVMTPHHYLVQNHERFENGTVDYLNIPAIKTGIDYSDRIGMDRITKRVQFLGDHLYSKLATLKHENGKSLINLFGPADRSNVGGTLIMTFLDQSGRLIPFEWVENLANEKMISIRSGCFCNPGIDEVNNCLTSDELSNYFSSRDNGNYKDMITYLNKMRGATRVSVGIGTSIRDLNVFIDFVRLLLNKNVEDLLPKN